VYGVLSLGGIRRYAECEIIIMAIILNNLNQDIFALTSEKLFYKQVKSPPNDRKIRLLCIINHLAIGGATNVALDIASYFNNHPDFDVRLLTGPVSPERRDITHLADKSGIVTMELPSLINQINPLANAKAVADIRKIIYKGDCDIVHTHTKIAGVIGRIAARAAKPCAIVHHVHGWGSEEGMSTVVRLLHLGLERLCAKFTDRIVVVARSDMQKGLANRIGREDKYALIYNGIDLEKFRQPADERQMRSELGLDPKSKLVGMIGRLEDQKNPLDFIRAAAEVHKCYSNVQFLMVGGGPLQSECEQLIKKLNLEGKFFLLGFRDDVAKILSILTMTTLSSLWEGLPIAFLESMSAGKPIVANNVGGAEDVVIDGETGYLVTPHQPSEMAERILFLLNNDELCKKMGQVARQRSGNFSKQRMLEQVESLYKELYYATNRGVESYKSPSVA
jgi:glycosyltransferase involved in cell wall biosynthesis